MVADTPVFNLPYSPSEKRVRASMSTPSSKERPRFEYELIKPPRLPTEYFGAPPEQAAALAGLLHMAATAAMLPRSASVIGLRMAALVPARVGPYLSTSCVNSSLKSWRTISLRR